MRLARLGPFSVQLNMLEPAVTKGVLSMEVRGAHDPLT